MQWSKRSVGGLGGRKERSDVPCISLLLPQQRVVIYYMHAADWEQLRILGGRIIGKNVLQYWYAATGEH